MSHASGNDTKCLTHWENKKMTSTTWLIITAHQCILWSIRTPYADTPPRKPANDASMYTPGMCTPLRSRSLNASPAQYVLTLASHYKQSAMISREAQPQGRTEYNPQWYLTICRDTCCWDAALSVQSWLNYVGTSPREIFTKQPPDGDNSWGLRRMGQIIHQWTNEIQRWIK